MLTTIIAFSTIMWYLVDRAKLTWENWKYGYVLTMLLAGALGFGLTFAFNLDLIFGLTLSEAISIPGQVLTGFSLMAGDEIEQLNFMEKDGD